MKKLAIFIISWLGHTPEMSLVQQKELIDSFDEPKDDIDRTYNQYRCSIAGKNILKQIVLEIVGIMACIPFLFVYVANGIRFKGHASNGADTVFINTKNKYGMIYKYEAFIPREYLREKTKLQIFEYKNYPPLLWGSASKQAIKCWMNITLRHPLRGYMNFNCMTHIMAINRIIREYDPKEILCYRVENKYESSLLTAFCESMGVEYNNFMHGELLLSHKRAFVRFSKLFIWDDHYKTIFQWGRSPEAQFVVYTPAALKNDYRTSGNEEYYATYYLSGGSAETHYKENVGLIISTLKALTQKGYTCKVRPHPRWSDISELSKWCGEYIYIEDPNMTTLDESIRQSMYVIGTMSTCLLQAYAGGKPVIIDDVSNPEYYKRMKESCFIMLKKKHSRLSEIMRSIAGNTNSEQKEDVTS